MSAAAADSEWQAAESPADVALPAPESPAADLSTTGPEPADEPASAAPLQETESAATDEPASAGDAVAPAEPDTAPADQEKPKE